MSNFQPNTTCFYCDGTGQVNGGHVCGFCNGTGIEAEFKFDFDIESPNASKSTISDIKTDVGGDE